MDTPDVSPATSFEMPLSSLNTPSDGSESGHTIPEISPLEVTPYLFQSQQTYMYSGLGYDAKKMERIEQVLLPFTVYGDLWAD